MDPQLGVFLSVDPVTAYQQPVGMFNRYRYAFNNPYRFADPDGRAPCDGPSTCRVATEERLVASGQMTQEQKQANDQARGVGALIGIGVVVAAKLGIDTAFAALANPRATTSIISGIAEAAGVTGTAASGVPATAQFAQKTFNAMFSSEGKLSGMSVQAVSSALKSGEMSVSSVPVNYVVRDGQAIILNTRSAVALEQAGIPRANWNGVNQTGNAFFEKLLDGQLGRNPGAPFSSVRQSGQ